MAYTDQMQKIEELVKVLKAKAMEKV